MENSEEEKTYKVVLTGFGPFRDIKVNESWLAVKELWEMEWPSQIRLVTREMPVIYDVVKSEVNKLWEEHKPDLIIHVGVSMDSTSVQIERQSFNLNYYSGDEADKCPENEVCIEGGSEILQTKLDVDNLCQVANAAIVSSRECDPVTACCQPSDDPGQYLCGYSYYLSLNKDAAKSLFVHVPGKDCCSVKEDAIALRAIIIEALKQLYNFNA